jgi:hypothetical protein
VEGAHLAERCGLFMIIALGESLLITGATFSGLEWTRALVVGMVAAFGTAVAMWWIYFDVTAELGSDAVPLWSLAFQTGGLRDLRRVPRRRSVDARRWRRCVLRGLAGCADGVHDGRARCGGRLGIAGLPASSRTGGPRMTETADFILQGGPILTLDAKNSRAEAVAVTDGRVLAVGTTDEIEPLRGAGTRIADLQGRALLPGFVDGHGHLAKVAGALSSANLAGPPVGTVEDIESLVAELRSFIAARGLPAYMGDRAGV